MFWNKKKTDHVPLRKRSYPFTYKEQELLKFYRLDVPTILPYIEAMIISEIQPFFWEENSYPKARTYYKGIIFAGRPMSLSVFFKFKKTFSEKGFKFYKSDAVRLTSKLAEFHYFGYETNELLDTPRECYMLIPDYETFDFLNKIDFECGDRSLLKSTLAKWKDDYEAETIWFDKHELLLYFIKTPTDIESFYKEYFEIVGCTFVSDFSDEERKQKLQEGLPSLYINFRSQ